MTGWNAHGHAVKTGLPIDRHLGSGDLQDAENCGYTPTSVLAELGVDTAHGDPLDQFRDGYITLLDGTWLSRGGALNSVWAVTRLPRADPHEPRAGILTWDYRQGPNLDQLRDPAHQAEQHPEPPTRAEPKARWRNDGCGPEHTYRDGCEHAEPGATP